MNFIAVFIGGGLGSLARYSIGLMVTQLGGISPIATLLANVTATAILMLIISQSNATEFFLAPRSPAITTLLTVGFCGAFSTFSTFAADTLQLHQSGGIAWAIANVGLNLVLCLGSGFWIWSMNQSAA